MKTDYMLLEMALREWEQKVLQAYAQRREDRVMVSTYQMVEDVDRIIADAFDRSPILGE